MGDDKESFRVGVRTVVKVLSMKEKKFCSRKNTQNRTQIRPNSACGGKGGAVRSASDVYDQD